MSHVLVVDDEPAICWSLRESLIEDGHQVEVASSLRQGLEAIDKQMPDAMFIDVRLPDGDGIDAIQQFQSKIGSMAPIIVMTAFGDLETAVRAVKAGVFEYLPKPFNLEDALTVIRRALALKVAPHTTPANELRTGALIGVSPAMQVVFKRIALVADSDTSVLISGESGVGKEEVALAIHRHSRRANHPFLPVCVGALSETVLESELFGHAKGAFTGADQTHLGLLELANHGTIFLDEVGDVSLSAQVKLLRAIERHEFTPVGNPLPRFSDFRVIAATHRRMSDLVQQGKFREDLLYRIRVFEIVIPPLRERVEDIPPLAEHFLSTFTGGQGRHLSDVVKRELCSRPWFGNVRELRNALEYAVVLARDSEIQLEHLPPVINQPDMSPTNLLEQQIREQLHEWALQQLAQAARENRDAKLHNAFLRFTEPVVLRAALENAQGNRVTAAKSLGIHRGTLRDKLRMESPCLEHPDATEGKSSDE